MRPLFIHHPATVPTVVGVAIVALDQGMKSWAMQALGAGARLEPVPGVLQLVYVQNTGMAFGLFAGASALLGVLASLVLLTVLWQARAWLRATDGLGRLSTASVVAGGVGNILDRIQHGFVVDYLSLLPLPIFQVFNSADVAISLGAVGLGITLWRDDRRTRRRDRSTPAPAPDAETPTT
ncbi:MAG TPA: signal peptidase II [Herpetosiphonaceae bacterium]